MASAQWSFSYRRRKRAKWKTGSVSSDRMVQMNETIDFLLDGSKGEGEDWEKTKEDAR